jgi:hypothetical protein
MPSARFGSAATRTRSRSTGCASRTSKGIAALDRGDYAEVQDEDLGAYLDDLAAPVRR